MATVAPVPVPSVPSSDLNAKSQQEALAAVKANIEALTGVHTAFHVNDTKTAIQTEIGVAISRASGV